MYEQRFGDLSGLGHASLLVLQLQSLALSSHISPSQISAAERIHFWLTNEACLLSVYAQIDPSKLLYYNLNGCNCQHVGSYDCSKDHQVTHVLAD